ncbi:MAG TPA: accessory factor UbiK family protein [Rhodopila sp.]|uniref:accessory factor UbiK family protein n=1 Tax=Rhodopila sp. TaxID=2480087 RepID=UPI002BEE9D81|nr:accessory factor UbiK family protein [Rhodopila sp.]HVY14578.1 accessory factor UbiK family protein [Rhodopila sp.]
MTDRPRFFDDLTGVAQGALATLAGLREETEAMVRARTDDMIERLELARREDLEAVKDLAANARAGQEAAEARLTELEARHAALEARYAALAERLARLETPAPATGVPPDAPAAG